MAARVRLRARVEGTSVTDLDAELDEALDRADALCAEWQRVATELRRRFLEAEQEARVEYLAKAQALRDEYHTAYQLHRESRMAREYSAACERVVQLRKAQKEQAG